MRAANRSRLTPETTVQANIDLNILTEVFPALKMLNLDDEILERQVFGAVYAQYPNDAYIIEFTDTGKESHEPVMVNFKGSFEFMNKVFGIEHRIGSVTPKHPVVTTQTTDEPVQGFDDLFTQP